MHLIAGLGNPGEKYKNSRHNVGFMAIEEFKERQGFPSFKDSKKFKGGISEGIIEEEKVVLAKPQTFMNNSGISIKKLKNFYKIDCSNIILVHDDLDIFLGERKISFSRSPAGHKGIDSIVQSLGEKNFIRVRIGIGKEKIENPKKFVLQNFSKAEFQQLSPILEETSEILRQIISQGAQAAMNKYN